MTMTSSPATEQTVQVGDLKLRLAKAGSGKPLLILHRDVGNSWLPAYDDLATYATVLTPDLPGFGKSDRPDWARDVRDLAALTRWMLDELKLERIDLMGLGFGGWIAAELAVNTRGLIRKLILVSPAGLQPKQGEIMDQFVMSGRDYVRAQYENAQAFTDLYGSDPNIDVQELWEIAREMTTRVAWKPYMFDRRLEPLLKSVKGPTLLVWGKQDKVIPVGVGDQFKAAIPNARLETIDHAGHAVEADQPKAFATLVKSFLA